MTEELYKRYRPQKFKDVIGQDDAVRSIRDMAKRKAIPHFLLLIGPSGVGKTTLARLLKKVLKCSDADFVEMNAAKERGIDMVRDISSRMGAAPLGGESRIWLIDECQSLTSDAENGFLKMLEDTPPHVYFMFCTTDPQKLKKTIITRATTIKCKALSEKDLQELVEKVYNLEAAKWNKSTQVHTLTRDMEDLNPKVIKRIAEVADGSARKALVILHAVIGLESVEDQLATIESSDVKKQAIEIARALMRDDTKWPKMSEILRGVDEEPESIRWMILSYCSKVMLGKGNHARAALIIEEFLEPFYNSKKAGLIISCYNVIFSA